MSFEKPDLNRFLSLFGFIAGVLMLGCQPLNSVPEATTPQSGSPVAEATTPEQPSHHQAQFNNPVIEPELPAAVAATPAQRLPITAQAQINDQVVELEVAETRQQQATGLMSRDSLADNRGMLFPFNPPQTVSFWMKNVLIDLDMIFLRDGAVVAVQHSAPPCRSFPCPTYGPEGKIIDQVIELRGGRAAELGIQAGDIITVQAISPES